MSRWVFLDGGSRWKDGNNINLGETRKNWKREEREV